jgi:hypothetical protein
LNLKEIDKARLFTSQKTGAIYLDAILMLNVEKDQYENNGMVVQSVSKEEREAGTRGPILGNAKILSWDEPTPQPAGVTTAQVADALDAEIDGLPF